jgi:hypothetical protein
MAGIARQQDYQIIWLGRLDPARRAMAVKRARAVIKSVTLRARRRGEPELRLSALSRFYRIIQPENSWTQVYSARVDPFLVGSVLAQTRYRCIPASPIDLISQHLFVPLREREQTLLREFVGLSSQAPAPCGLLSEKTLFHSQPPKRLPLAFIRSGATSSAASFGQGHAPSFHCPGRPAIAQRCGRPSPFLVS